MALQRDTPTPLFALVSLALAAYFLLPGSPSPATAALDDMSFQLWSRLLPPAEQRTAPELLAVELPAPMREAERPRLEYTRSLNQLLGELQRAGVSAIGVAADLRPLLWPARDVAALLPESGARSLEAQLVPHRELEERLRELPIAWLRPPPRLGGREVLVDREFRWPVLYTLHERLLNASLAEDEPAGAEVLPTPPSLLHFEDGRWLAGQPLSLLAFHEHAPAVRWLIPDELLLGQRSLPTSMVAAIRPWPADETLARLFADARQTGALGGDIQGRIAVLGFPGDPAMAGVLTTVNALLTGQFSHAPWWQWVPVTALTLALWGLGCLAARRCGATTLVLAAPLVLALPVAFTLLVHGQRGVWIETGAATAYAGALLALLLGYRLFQNIRLQLRLEADDARLELAQLHLAHSDPKAAATQLQRASMTPDAADLLVEAGQAFERQRDFQAARAAYRAVTDCYPGNRQAATALAGIADLTHSGHALGATLALAAAPPAIGQLGRYKIQGTLGQGAMGIVYLASDPRIRRDVAIKTLPLQTIEEHGEDIRGRFFREAETAGQLQHPNIVSVYDVGEEGDLAYIAMDYVPGGTLADWTHPDELLDLETLYSLMEQVAQGLAYAHKQGVVHRDIKPGNILYNPADGSVKITDFGIARLADYSRTRTGAILGSPYYMSPEQVSGKKVGAASDLYSLGVSFFQLLSGALPFEGESLAQLAWQITNNPHRNLGRFRKGLPRSASRIVGTALQKDPRERFPHAADMAEAFSKGAQSLAASRRKAG